VKNQAKVPLHESGFKKVFRVLDRNTLDGHMPSAPNEKEKHHSNVSKILQPVAFFRRFRSRISKNICGTNTVKQK